MAKKHAIPTRGAKRPAGGVDLDGTIERENTTSLALREGVIHGLFPASLGENYEQLRLQQRDHRLSFETYDRAMLELFSKHMRGIRQEDLDRVAQVVVEKHRDWRYLFTEALIGRMHETHRTIMITGALEQIAKRLTTHWGLDAYDASILEVDGHGRFTGETVSCPALDKRSSFIRFAGDGRKAFKGSIAIGDTMSDKPMLELAERPIAFNPVFPLAKLAREADWPIARERKGCITVTYRGREELFNAYTEADKAVAHALACRG